MSRGETGGDRVLHFPPADLAVLLASGGLFGVGRWGGPSGSGRVSSLGPSSSRFVFQGGVGEVSTVAPSRNKSLRPRSCSGGARSGVDGRFCKGGVGRIWCFGINSWHLLYRSLASSGASSSGGDGDEVHRATHGSWQFSDGMLDGIAPHLGGFPMAPASSRSGTQGVCPRPMVFLGLYDPVSRGGWLLRLLPKPVGDDHVPDLQRPPMRRWIPMSNDTMGGHSGSDEPSCYFIFPYGSLCCLGGTATSVPAVSFMVVCVSVRGVVRFCYVLIQVCFIKKKTELPLP